MNYPYIKEYNKKGEWINQLDGPYLHDHPNRQQRRLPEPRFKNNRRSYSVVANPAGKVIKWLQPVYDRMTGKVIRMIQHSDVVKHKKA